MLVGRGDGGAAAVLPVAVGSGALSSPTSCPGRVSVIRRHHFLCLLRGLCLNGRVKDQVRFIFAFSPQVVDETTFDFSLLVVL